MLKVILRSNVNVCKSISSFCGLRSKNPGHGDRTWATSAAAGARGTAGGEATEHAKANMGWRSPGQGDRNGGLGDMNSTSVF
jgi:hypothetical protein